MTIRALLVGINYEGTPYELKGCINDTIATRDMLRNKFKVRDENIVMMNDISREKTLDIQPRLIFSTL